MIYFTFILGLCHIDYVANNERLGCFEMIFIDS